MSSAYFNPHTREGCDCKTIQTRARSFAGRRAKPNLLVFNPQTDKCYFSTKTASLVKSWLNYINVSLPQQNRFRSRANTHHADQNGPGP